MTDYARHEHHDFLNAARQALADVPLQEALVRLTSTDSSCAPAMPNSSGSTSRLRAA